MQVASCVYEVHKWKVRRRLAEAKRNEIYEVQTHVSKAFGQTVCCWRSLFVIILLHERWRYDSLIIYTLTWSPGCGLIRETWSYPRRKRARIASSLPWTGDKNTYNVLRTPAASVNNDSDSYPDGRIPLPVLSGLPVWLSGLGFEGFKLLLGHLYDSVFGFFQLGSLLGGALASPANLEQSQKHQIISSETCHIISPALQHTQLSASFWDETSSNLKSLLL